MAEELSAPFDEVAGSECGVVSETKVVQRPAGVGRLADVIGIEEARAWFDERDERHRFLYGRALQRWGMAGHVAIGGARPYNLPKRSIRADR